MLPKLSYDHCLSSKFAFPRFKNSASSVNLTMAKKSKLLAALDAHKGKDYKLQKQKKLRKQADRRKRSRPQPESSYVDDEEGGALNNGAIKELGVESDGWESEESEEAAPTAVGLFYAPAMALSY